MSDRECLLELNEEYVRASLAGDVRWYSQRLADDFVCIESDGTVLDKAAFLRHTSAGSDLVLYRLEEVDVRCYSNVGLVRATGRWVARDGTRGLSRYVDVYVLANGEWRCVSAQVTRPPDGRH